LIKGHFIQPCLYYSSTISSWNFRFDGMPSWSDLMHFDQVVSVNFTDVTKLEHLVKVCTLLDEYCIRWFYRSLDFAFLWATIWLTVNFWGVRYFFLASMHT
jgi:hypothetical protein